MVETRSSNARVGQNALETRELFCPSSRLSEGEDPGTWSDQELLQKLSAKTCLRMICRTDQFTSNHCQGAGDETLKPDLIRMREGK